MQMEAGKYRGCELSEVPTDYLEWAAVHLCLNPEQWDGVMAERSRRINSQRLEAETPMQKRLERPLQAFNKIAARLRLAVKGR